MSDLANRRLDLLTRQVTEGLEPTACAELAYLSLDLASPSLASFERAAAAIELAYLRSEPMPDPVRQRVASRLRATIAQRH